MDELEWVNWRKSTMAMKEMEEEAEKAARDIAALKSAMQGQARLVKELRAQLE